MGQFAPVDTLYCIVGGVKGCFEKLIFAGITFLTKKLFDEKRSEKVTINYLFFGLKKGLFLNFRI